MKVLAENRKAFANYEILEKIEGGLVLLGTEVKSAKEGRMQIKGSYLILDKGGLWLTGSLIPPYQPKNAPPDYQEQKPRKVLVHKEELSYLTGKAKERGLTLVPLKVYTTPRGRIKIEFAIARGKKRYDKRETIRKREAAREIARAMKERI